jgi:acetone carboxylase gamma subunit
MNQPRPMSPTLDIRDVAGSDKICCTGCGYALAPAGYPWKPASIVSEIPTEILAHEGATGEPADTVLRLFACRGCGALLDSETALSNEPFLDDIVRT